MALDELRLARFRCSLVMQNTIITALGTGSAWHRARELLKHDPDVVSFNATSHGMKDVELRREAGLLPMASALNVLQLVGQSGLEATAMSFNGTMAQVLWLQGLKLLRREEVSCNTAMGLLKSWWKALWVLELMQSWGLQPNMMSYNQVSSMCGWQTSALLVARLCGAQLRANELICSSLVSSAESWCRALALKAMLWHSQVDGGGNAALNSCPWQQSLLLLEAMDGEEDAISCCAAITACNEASQWRRALQLFCGMEGSQVPPDLLCTNAAMMASALGVQWQFALHLLQAADPNSLTLAACIDACESVGQWQHASRLVLRLEQLPDLLHGREL